MRIRALEVGGVAPLRVTLHVNFPRTERWRKDGTDGRTHFSFLPLFPYLVHVPGKYPKHIMLTGHK